MPVLWRALQRIVIFWTLAASLLVLMDARSAIAATEFRLVEFTPWLVKNYGPEKSKGVVYFVRGWGQFFCCRNRDDFRALPYFVVMLANDGWDIIAGKIPEEPRSERAFQAVAAGTAYVTRRVKELKQQGYKRVVLGGHSWGGWLALSAGQNSELDADAVILSSPSTYGPVLIPGGPRKGQPNPFHMKNWTEFQRLIDKLSRPAILVTMTDDPFEPDAPRGRYAAKRLGERNIPHVVIDKPVRFNGHSGGWLPVFDFIYGACIQAFLNHPKTQVCEPRDLKNGKDDFRSVVGLSKLRPDESNFAISPRPLVGRKYVAYTLGDAIRGYEYVSATERLNMYSLEQARETYSFKRGLHCVGSKCSILVWRKGAVLEFNAKTGKLAAWWIERR